MMFAGTPFIPGLGDCFASACVCSWFQGRAWDLERPGMEVRIHRVHPACAHQLSDTSPQSQAGLFSPAP